MLEEQVSRLEAQRHIDNLLVMTTAFANVMSEKNAEGFRKMVKSLEKQAYGQ